MAAILLESKQFVVGSKVCGFSGPVIMAAPESAESHRAVGELLLPSPLPLWLPTPAAYSCSPASELVWANSPPFPATLWISFAGLLGGLRGGGNSPLPRNSLKVGVDHFLNISGWQGRASPLSSVLPSPPSHLVLPQGRSTWTNHILSDFSQAFWAIGWGSQARVVSALHLVAGLLNCLSLFPVELQCSPQKLS